MININNNNNNNVNNVEEKKDKTGLITSETTAQVFSCEFCEIFKNTYFEEHLQRPASAYVDLERTLTC